MDKLRFFAYLLLPLFWPLCLGAQSDLIHFVNASFEDLPKSGEAPVGWYDCGQVNETPPDIQPGQFNVTKPPKHGDTYLGLVVRDNDTWEAVAQRLQRPLMANQCYEFTADICRSEIYMSISKTTGQNANYTTPARLLVWGGYGFCDKRELLYQSADITHDRWLTTNIRLAPKNGNYTHILFEAYFIQPTLFAYNGNVLLDNLSPITQLDCNPSMPTRVVSATTKPDKGKKAPPKSGSKTGTSSSASTHTSKGGQDSGSKTAFKKGDIIRIDKLYFDADRFDIKPDAEASLLNILRFLKDNPRVVVEVGGHTNNRAAEAFAMELSTNRAKAVAEWLVGHGIPGSRVQYKGYGFTQPIAPNETTEGRNKNQRVEIKILSTEG